MSDEVPAGGLRTLLSPPTAEKLRPHITRLRFIYKGSIAGVPIRVPWRYKITEVQNTPEGDGVVMQLKLIFVGSTATLTLKALNEGMVRATVSRMIEVPITTDLTPGVIEATGTWEESGSEGSITLKFA